MFILSLNTSGMTDPISETTTRTPTSATTASTATTAALDTNH